MPVTAAATALTAEADGDGVEDGATVALRRGAGVEDGVASAAPAPLIVLFESDENPHTAAATVIPRTPAATNPAACLRFIMHSLHNPETVFARRE